MSLAASLGLAWSLQVQALGLGDIEVRSALNQPLDADISLLSVKSDEISRINVRLADDIAYLTSGVDRTPLLNQLIFTVTQDGSNVVVKVNTRDAIKEPFLDFIIEVNWPSGRLLREYTVLLDPPVFAGESAATVAAPEAAPKTTAPTPAPARATRPAPAAETPRAQAPRPAASGAAASGGGAARAASGASAPAAGSAGEFGPVGRSDTLGTIAQQVRPSEEYSLEQVMMALYNANPDAFFDENINNLRAGSVLRTPDEATIAEIGRSQAVEQAREHYRRWLDARRKKAAAGGREVGTEAGLAAMGGESSGADAGRAAAGGASDGQLRLLSPEDAAVSGGGGDGAGAGAGAFSDIAELQGLEKKDLQDRIVALESELQKMQRLVTLKDDLLTQFQSRVTGAGDFGAIPEPSPAETSPLASISEEAPLTGEPAHAAAEGAGEELTETAGSGVPPPAVPDQATAEVEPAAETEAGHEGEGSLVSMVTDPQVLALLVGVLLLLGAGGWMVARRRRQAQDYDLPYVPDESDVKLPSAAELAQRSQPASSVPAAGMTPSFAGGEEFGAGGLEALETDESEIDPVAEADVYLAYRRFQQAEELIREALRKEPDRQDLQLKMLEIYFGSGNKEAFEAQAEALYAMLGGEDNETWQRVLEMGQELCPDHPLFSGAGATAGGAGHDAFARAGAGVAAAGMAGAAASAPDDFGNMWDTSAGGFDADLGGVDSGQAPAQTEPSAYEENPFQGLNFEPGLGEGTTVKASAREQPAPEGVPDFGQDSAGLDFDLSGFDFGKFGQGGEEAPAAQDDPFATPGGFAPQQPAATRGTAAGGFGQDEDFAVPGGGMDDFARLMGGSQGEVEEVFTGLDDGSDGEDLFAGSDMVGTKLDLARAYIDMDDRDGARNILNEVIEEGNDTQKAEAHELMKKIG